MNPHRYVFTLQKPEKCDVCGQYNSSSIHSQRTNIDPESYAYNTYSGSQWRSNRRGKVLDEDGETIVNVVLGIPDTSFTIPAHTASKRRRGYVDWNDDLGEYQFHEISR